MLEVLPRVVPYPEGRERPDNDDHPMRRVTRELATDPGTWTPERRAKVAGLFDSLAPGWADRYAQDPGRFDAVRDALERGGAAGAGAPAVARWSLDVGSGIGMLTPLLTEHLGPVVSLDLSAAMLAAAAPGPKVLADAAFLPFADASLRAVVLVNAFLFPAEVDRVLAPGGSVIWVSTLGPDTPIWLPIDDVEALLPGAWEGVRSEAGPGTWAVLRRAR